jgi:hypothetical protein
MRRYGTPLADKKGEKKDITGIIKNPDTCEKGAR